MAALGATGGEDSDLTWIREYSRMYQAEARICSGAYYKGAQGCFYPPAADPQRPSAYSALWTRDFEYTMEFMWDVFDTLGQLTAHEQAVFIVTARPVRGNQGTNDEPMFQAKMISNLANYSGNSTLFCTYVGQTITHYHSNCHIIWI